nr:DNA methyltransferase [uncultured Porphyromonas sp.]
MAKKSKIRGWQEIESDLKQAFASPVSPSDIPYLLLATFGSSPAEIKRYREGKGTMRSFDGLLIKKLFCYRAVAESLQLGPTLEALKGEKLVESAQPKIIAVSDGSTLLAWDTREQESYENVLTGLWSDYRFFYPLMGVERCHTIAEVEADVRAAEKLGRLHDELRAHNDFATEGELHELNLFITRLLFCFFAEDTGIFPEGLFTNSIQQFTQLDGSDLGQYLESAFAIMDVEERTDRGNQLIQQFPYVNGGLFARHARVPTMSARSRKLILECGALNWRDINPDIFGSMIQAVADGDLRSSVGMHYTSVPNIRKVIDPLFLDDLRATYTTLQKQEQEAEHAFRLGQIKQRELQDRRKKLLPLCDSLLDRIGRMRFFDPACGSGNFLIITYKELRLLEMDILSLKRSCQGLATGMDFVGDSVISIGQFYGIELLDFPHEVAKLSLWLAQHQMNKLLQERFGYLIPALPLKNIEGIRLGNACTLDWEEVCPHSPEDEVYIFGNPPYLGSRVQEASHKADMALVFKGEPKYKDLDYICCWFAKAARFIQGTKAQVAFVSTNSITQGLQVPLLWNILNKYGVEIGFAHTSFKWTNNAKGNAGVTVIILSLRSPSSAPKYLYTPKGMQIVDNISPYLIDAPSLVIEGLTKPLNGDSPQMYFGNMPNDGGALIINEKEREHLIAQDNRLKRFIRPLVGAQELVRGLRRYCLRIVDRELEEAKQSPEIVRRLAQIQEFRSKSTEISTRMKAQTPHRFYFSAHKESPRIIIPAHTSEVREYIPMDYQTDGKTIVLNSALAVYDAPMWLFAVLTSRMHMAWMRTIGGKLETRYRYSAQICYNTFPFPRLSKQVCSQLEAAAEEVLLCRADYVGKTLAELYDPKTMPEPLRQAHAEVDRLVDACYRSEGFASDEERLAELFRRYASATR